MSDNGSSSDRAASRREAVRRNERQAEGFNKLRFSAFQGDIDFQCAVPMQYIQDQHAVKLSKKTLTR